MRIDPSNTYVALSADGSTRQVPAAGFWDQPAEELDGFGPGWLVSEFECTADWTNWEMHPEGDEFVYLLCGEATLHLERDGAIECVPLEGRGAVVIPRGVWHTAKVRAPCRMLFVTRGAGTRHRPVG